MLRTIADSGLGITDKKLKAMVAVVLDVQGDKLTECVRGTVVLSSLLILDVQCDRLTQCVRGTVVHVKSDHSQCIISHQLSLVQATVSLSCILSLATKR